MSASPTAQVPSTAVAQLAAELEQATSPEALLRVVRALGALGQVEGIPYLIRAFGFNRPAVGEAALEEVLRFGELAVKPLLEQIDGFDYGARAYSVRALARIGHGDAYPFLVEAIVADFAPSVRRAAVRGLGRVVARRPVPDQERALVLLQQCLSDSDWGVRYAAVGSLTDLARSGEPLLRPQARAGIQTALDDADPLIPLRAQMSQQELAADP
ncbi:HEAT repeat domain-containing protein [Synechococcus sp. Nb3U1]|uniref:HEAT repeat domain-containing protein n=1 Tax=Synechococcus sp. Nb3U1 TaxID=1914529 RepID=UPI001F490B45|nr:HEAT repeat domain-containing protein [Synechococcus sp. Nb3U1]MCF2971214.1 HEAT repeat domain-containing protein [Synechococcus sp. Nb3U1]